jgi:hypothetical protein
MHSHLADLSMAGTLLVPTAFRRSPCSHEVFSSYLPWHWRPQRNRIGLRAVFIGKNYDSELTEDSESESFVCPHPYATRTRRPRTRMVLRHGKVRASFLSTVSFPERVAPKYLGVQAACIRNKGRHALMVESTAVRDVSEASV